MHAWIDVAVLARTRNLKGRFVAKCTAGLPFLLAVGDEVAFVPPQLDAVRNARVSEVREIDGSCAEVSFEGIDGDMATLLVGCHCLIPRSLINEGAIADAPIAWQGWAVVDDELGPVGTVEGLLDDRAQALLEVRRGDGEGTLLVPLVDEIVLEAKPQEQTVCVRLPHGLLDL